TNDDSFVAEHLLEPLVRILRRYRAGTSLGIQCDENGLLATRQPGIGTTWMNAKIGDWVITPRAGRPVELNALWHNALRIAAELHPISGRRRPGTDLRAFRRRRPPSSRRSACLGPIGRGNPAMLRRRLPGSRAAEDAERRKDPADDAVRRIESLNHRSIESLK